MPIAPFLLARTWSTLDHISNGRIGWNVVTSFGESAAKQMGYEKEISHDQRYEAADEYMDLVYS
jgi:alkanesulfonate monooxygenase SsuD/methylene tetrahydromethanopterin reductase-like flavin-dependent oxidoreductase (luciferase family)